MAELRTLAEVLADIAACDKRFEEIDTEIERLRDERRETGRNRGQFCDEERFVRSLAVAGGFHVKWVGEGPRRSEWWYVEKVTSKLIFVKYGYEYSRDVLRFNLDGTSPGRYSSRKIDIQATFGVPAITAEIWESMAPQREAAKAAMFADQV